LQPVDVDSIAEVLVQTLTDHHLLEDLQARGLKRAAIFSWEKTAGMTQQLYRQVAAIDQKVNSDVEPELSMLLDQSKRS
jgi:glycosyltransferase involved in cell wall biosynthesis